MKKCNAYLSWIYHLAYFYFHEMPWKLVVSVFSLVFSRVCQVFAFFIPIKLFIILSSDRMPHYMQFLSEYLSREEVVISLSLLVPIFYILYVAFGILHRRVVDEHFECLYLEETMIRGVFLSRKNLVKMHGYCVLAVSDFALVLLSMLSVFFLNGVMAFLWVMIVYINIIFLFNFVFLNFKENRVSFLKIKHKQFIEYFSSANYLVVFIFLVYQSFFIGIGLFSAIFILLLSRMMFRAFSGFMVSAFNIYRVVS